MIQNKALKRRIVEISYKLKLGHIGSCLTAVDIIEEIYKIKKPDEKVIISSGHAHLAHLVVMEEYLNRTHIPTCMCVTHGAEILIEKYGIHCDRQAGCDVSTGSLGHCGIAIGLAIANRHKNVYILSTDGEANEGSFWESLRIANELNLTNLKWYLNANGYGAYQSIDTDKLEERIKSFGFPVEIRRTDSNIFPFMKGLLSHYYVLKPEDYERAKLSLE